MDLSQLPKMSDTPKPPPPMPEATPVAPDAYREPGGGFGPVAVWISLVIGLIFCMLGANALRWALATLSGREFATGVNWLAGPNAGTPVRYFDLQGGTAWSDVGFFTMGVALLIDATLLFFIYNSRRPRPLLLGAALFATGVALAINVGVAAYLMTHSPPILPLSSMVAVLVGGMMLFEQIGLRREMRG